jgi:hypothetical protein
VVVLVSRSEPPQAASRRVLVSNTAQVRMVLWGMMLVMGQLRCHKREETYYEAGGSTPASSQTDSLIAMVERLTSRA